MRKKLTLLFVALLSIAAFAATQALTQSRRAGESETIFSATVSATEKVSFGNGTTEITAEQATLAGGKMYAISAQADAKNLIANQSSYYMFCMTNNDTYFKVELDKALAVGDVISAMTYSRTDTNLGLFVTASDSRPNECATKLSIAQKKPKRMRP